MARETETEDCGVLSWGMAAAIAFLAFVLLIVLGDWRVISAIFVAVVLLGGLGTAFSLIFCSKLPARGSATPMTPAPPPQPRAAAPAAAALAEPVPPAPTAEAKPEPTAEPEPESEPAEAMVPTPGAPMPAPADAADAAEAPVPPKLLKAAPKDGGDDLKRIKGIGPKLEQLCKSLGIYRFEQIAAWTEAEVAWVDANLDGFKGRVTRDEWVAQAQALAEDRAGN